MCVFPYIGTSLFESSQRNMFLQQDKQQFHVGKREDAPKLNFGGSVPNLAFGQAPCANIGLSNTTQTFGGPANFAFGQPQAAGSQMSNSGVPSSNGFNFNANAGINFNFASSNPNATTGKFVAGNSDPGMSNRIMKKAVRRRRQ